MTQHPDLFAALAAPFDPSELKVRSQAGRQIPYVTARNVMNRLDEVLGPENWWDDFVPLEHSVICRLTIRLPDGTVLTKCDAGGYAGLADPGDDDKSGFADAFKRTAVKFGVGRYLYRDGVASFARRNPKKSREPEPEPAGMAHPTGPAPPIASTVSPSAATDPGTTAPRTGRALFAWTKDQDEKFEFGLLRYLNTWGKRQEFPARMVDWDSERVSQAFSEACRRIASLEQSRQGEAAVAST
jgi:Rad52/22 family double-strand break repair protein